MATQRSTPKRTRTRKKIAQEPNHELIDELKEWSKRTKVQDDPYIISLISDLESVSDLDTWAALSPVDLLPMMSHHAGDKRLRISNILTIARNILVFVPVALTWFAVGKATAGFEKYTNENADAVSNFLQFWQNCYGILDKKWTIGHVAVLDAQIISGVIALTMITAFLNQKHVQDQKVALAKLDNERLAMGIKIHKYLHANRAVTTETINAFVANSVKNLQVTSKAMAQASKELRKDINQIPSNKQVIAEVKRLMRGL